MRQCLLFCFFLLVLRLPAQVFMRPFDPATAMGMGGAVIAIPDAGSGNQNPALLGVLSGWSVQAGTALPYSIKDWQSAHVQGMASLGKNAGAFGASIWHSGTENYTEQRFEVAYGRRLGEKCYLGAQADLLHNNAVEYGAATTATFGIGILVQALPKVWLGAGVLNPFQQQLGNDLLPTVARVGACWKPEDRFSLSIESEKDLERPVQIKAGMEYHPGSILVLRAGARTGKVARMSFGLGLKLKNGLSLHVASEWHPVLGITPAAVVVWRK